MTQSGHEGHLLGSARAPCRFGRVFGHRGLTFGSLYFLALFVGVRLESAHGVHVSTTPSIKVMAVASSREMRVAWSSTKRQITKESLRGNFSTDAEKKKAQKVRSMQRKCESNIRNGLS